MRTKNALARALGMAVLVAGIALGSVVTAAAGRTGNEQAVAGAPGNPLEAVACGTAPAAQAPDRVWRGGRFAGP